MSDELREVARQVVRDDRFGDASDDDEQWRLIASLGWAGLLVAEEHGGLGVLPREAGVVLEELGYRAVGGPLLASGVLSAVALGALADHRAARRHLAAVAAGEVIATVAVPFADDIPSVTVEQQGARAYLRGEVPYVLDADRADVVVLAATDDRGAGALFVLDVSEVGLEVDVLPVVDETRRLCRVRIDAEVPALAAVGGDRAVADVSRLVTDLAAAAIACDSAGGTRRVTDLAATYARERIQFGRAIGSFQAVKHKCADMYLAAKASSAIAEAAMEELAEAVPTAPRMASMAKAYATDAYVEAAHQAVLVHGAIGVTWEHELHRFVKRSKLNRALFGSSAWHRQRIVASVAAQEAG